jgi:hypothetical protein
MESTANLGRSWPAPDAHPVTWASQRSIAGSPAGANCNPWGMRRHGTTLWVFRCRKVENLNLAEAQKGAVEVAGPCLAAGRNRELDMVQRDDARLAVAGSLAIRSWKQKLSHLGDRLLQPVAAQPR